MINVKELIKSSLINREKARQIKIKQWKSFLLTLILLLILTLFIPKEGVSGIISSGIYVIIALLIFRFPYIIFKYDEGLNDFDAK